MLGNLSSIQKAVAGVVVVSGVIGWIFALIQTAQKAYPLASGSSRYGPTGHYRFGGQTREIATKPWPCRDVSGRGRHTTSWATGANGISLSRG